MSEQEIWFLVTKLPSGEKWRYNVRAVQEMLGVKALRLDVQQLYSRLMGLEQDLERLEAPARQNKIVELLQKSEKPRTKRWIQARVPRFSGMDLITLLADGKIVKIEPEGRGHVKYEPAERWLDREVYG